ncbi:type II CAAX endopeptidase family protein [Cytophagaceae bacterium DM2B3-1]|uniref:Type II CAAX endopeptidase family protein n=1 Tax=Xanthocytophaga flava TaxID=3048013 RepID=A0ABT7CU99_9BACT|nr:type II CAAX endopeptidase family protein [Xanthocytophaga flavus]MDJ1471744.1 type II CAAX endopeptidase family protein [Xanthocytophaga flavus]MDJ1496507.1 type II CAAX endopeptidase family protein [Xanthocytophaga flavus]
MTNSSLLQRWTIFNKPAPLMAFFKVFLYWIVVELILLGSGFLASLFPLPISRYGFGLFGCLGSTLITLWFIRKDNQSFQSMGFQYQSGTIPRFLLGFFLGLLVMPVVIAIFLLTEPVQLISVDTANMELFIVSAISLIPMVFAEEVVFRLYSLKTLQPYFGIWTTQLIIAFVFGLYHLLYGWSIVDAMVGTSLWSLVFGLSAVLSRGIAVSTGIHFAVNIGQILVGKKQSLWTLKPIHSATTDWEKHMHSTASLIGYGIVVLWIIVLVVLILKKKRLKEIA